MTTEPTQLHLQKNLVNRLQTLYLSDVEGGASFEMDGDPNRLISAGGLHPWVRQRPDLFRYARLELKFSSLLAQGSTRMAFGC